MRPATWSQVHSRHVQKGLWEFPCHPEVRIWRFPCRGLGPIPDWGWCSQKCTYISSPQSLPLRFLTSQHTQGLSNFPTKQMETSTKDDVLRLLGTQLPTKTSLALNHETGRPSPSNGSERDSDSNYIQTYLAFIPLLSK